MKNLWILFFLAYVPSEIFAQQEPSSLPYGAIIVPLVLDEATVEKTQWAGDEEIWLEIAYLNSPQGEVQFIETGEKLWWIGETPVVFLGATGDYFPTEVANRGIAWVQLAFAGEALGDVHTIWPRRDRLRLVPDAIQVQDALGKTMARLLPGVDAAYLSQVANFLSGNLANLDVVGTSYSIAGFGEVINGSGQFVGDGISTMGPLVSDGSIVINGMDDQITTSSGTLDFDDEDLTTAGNIGIGTTTPSEALTIEGGSLLQNPTTPVPTGRLLNNGVNLVEPRRMVILGSYAYIVAPTTDTVEIINIADPSNPILVGSITDDETTLLDFPSDIYVSGNYAYIASHNDNALEILDISNPSQPTHVGSLVDDGARSLHKTRIIVGSGKYVYMGSEDEGIEIVDVSDPANPTHVSALTDGAVGTLDGVSGLYIQGDYLYVAATFDNAIAVLDVSDPTAPTKVGAIVDDATTALVRPRWITVCGGYAYVVGEENGVEILDITDPANPTHAGAIFDDATTALARPMRIQVAGNFAFVTSFDDNGVEVLDISDPTNPTHVAALIDDGTTALTAAFSLGLAGKHAYVGSSEGLEVLDISGIDAVAARIGSLSATNLTVKENGSFGNNVLVRNSLNVGSGGILSGGDVSIEGDLNVSGNVTGLNYTNAFETLNADSGTTSADSAMDSLTVSGAGTVSTSIAGDILTITGVEVDGDVTNELQNLFSTVNGDSGTTTADAQTDSLNVVGDGTISTAIAGDTLTITGAGDNLGNHTANQNLDLSTFNLVGNGGSVGLSIANDGDVTFGNTITIEGGSLLQNPTTPVPTGRLLNNGVNLVEPRRMVIMGSYAYIVAPTTDTVEIINIADPSNPILVGSITDDETTLLDFPSDIYVSGNYAYIASHNDNALEILDISNPSQPTHVGSLVDDGVRSLHKTRKIVGSGKYVYMGSEDEGIEIVDVSDPANPTHVSALTNGAVGTLDGVSGLYIQGDYLYVAATFDNAIAVLDVSDPTAPTKVGAIVDDATTALLRPRWITVCGGYAYVVGEENGVEILDISDPANPTHVGAIFDDATTALARPIHIQVAGNFAFVTSFDDNGVEVLDVSDPTNPTHLAALIDDGTTALTEAFSLGLAGKHAYVGSSEGLEVLDISGIDVVAARIGSLSATNLTVKENGSFGNNVLVRNSLNVGSGGILSGGDVGIEGDVTITGDLTVTGSCTGCSSDENLKRNIHPLTNALDKISQLNGVTYDWVDDVREAYVYPGPQIGVLAQDVASVYPELVGVDSRGYQFVQYQKLVAPLIEAVKELKDQNAAMKALLCSQYPQADFCGD